MIWTEIQDSKLVEFEEAPDVITVARVLPFDGGELEQAVIEPCRQQAEDVA